jgi:glycosyltransferase involved in cell wall biosynthesis
MPVSEKTLATPEPFGSTRSVWPTQRTVLVVTHGFEANYVVGFARGLRDTGVPVVVLSADDTAARLTEAAVSNSNIRGSQNEDRPGTDKAFNLLRYYVRLFGVVLKRWGQPLHFIGLLNSRLILLDGIFLPIWFRLCAKRYIHTAHNALPHSKEGNTLYKLAYRWIYKFPHIILTHSDAVAKRLTAEFGVSPSRIRTVPIGLNQEVQPAALTRTEAREVLGLKADRPVVLFFGKIERYKGCDVLVKAWDRVAMRDAHLLICGLAPDLTYAEELERSILRASNGRSIEWRRGFVPNETVALLLAAADVLILPYRSISQSGVIFLALSHGIPVISTDVGSMREYITEEIGIIATSNDAPGIAAAIDEFFQRKDHFHRSNIAAYANNFGWDKQCERLKDLYE